MGERKLEGLQEMVKVISEADRRLERYENLISRVVEGWRFKPKPKTPCRTVTG